MVQCGKNQTNRRKTSRSRCCLKGIDSKDAVLPGPLGDARARRNKGTSRQPEAGLVDTDRLRNKQFAVVGVST